MNIVKVLLGIVIYLNIGFLFGKLCAAKNNDHCPKFLEFLLWPFSSDLTPGFLKCQTERFCDDVFVFPDDETYVGFLTFLWPVKVMLNILGFVVVLIAVPVYYIILGILYPATLLTKKFKKDC